MKVEHVLIEKVKRGDPKAFQELFNQFEREIYTLAYRLVGNREDAEDVTQEVAWILWSKIKSFRNESSLSTWLYRVTANTALQLLRKKKKIVYVEPNFHTAEDMHLMLEMAVMDLPDSQRALIVLRDIYNFPIKDIARMLDITEENVRVQLHRARKALRKKLEGGENDGVQRSAGTDTGIPERRINKKPNK
ncbi:RNA polymerase sigma factor [Coprothermobacter platensis]|uniref:RNA polymerase sigma factor n=1 Tax=Coprothermobacter platensis TaxID=108819 RepID=UPI00036890ED|nr:RNA polymerase sigma factor [Coprothermobacter platensis]